MPDSETIRPASPADVPKLGALFRQVFRHDRDDAIWQWKYFDNPRGTYSFVCEAGGEIVVHCGGTPVVVGDGERRFVALQSVDFMSTPSYAGGLAGGGVFARTVRAFFDRYCGADAIPMVYGFPGERHRHFGERMLGYRPVERVGELTLMPRTSRRPATEPVDAARLALVSQEPATFSGIRDVTYLRWRYELHPLHKYETIRVKSWFSRPLIAVVRELENEIALMELEGDYSARNVKALGELLSRFGKPVRGWGSKSHPRTGALLEAGFEWSARDHLLECRFFDERRAPREGEFYYSLGDYDVY